MRRFFPAAAFFLLLMGFLNGGCATRESYKLSLVFTSDCTGYLEDCG
ncbi:MAG: hypothetical protein WC326_13965 [Candidatus Delongbacteria bacterium]|jgi:hypothetical protein